MGSVKMISALSGRMKFARNNAEGKSEKDQALREEFNFNSLASRRRSQGIFQHSGKHDEGRATALHDAMYRQEIQQVRDQIRCYLTNCLAIFDKKEAAIEAQLATARHPARDVFLLPMDFYGPKKQQEFERRRNLYLDGEATTARCGRLANSLAAEALAVEIKKQMDEGNPDAVASFLEAAHAKWKRLPDPLQELETIILETDFFHENYLAEELRALKGLKDEVQSLLDARPAIVTEEEATAYQQLGAGSTPQFAEGWDE